MYNDVIYLLSVTHSTNDIGDIIETPKSEMRFARMKSIGQTEFYQAQAQGLKPEIKFELADYLDTYRAGNKLELVCHGGIRLEGLEDGNS